MPKSIGARTNLRKPNSQIKRNSTNESVLEKIKTGIETKAEKIATRKNAKIEKTQKLHEQARIKRENKLERSPKSDVVDFSSDEMDSL